MKNRLESYIASIVFCTIITTGISFSNFALAQAHKHDHTFTIGIGYVLHMFDEEDPFRKASGDYRGDQINALAGPEAYLEYFLGKYLSLGVKYQQTGGGIIYRVSSASGSAEVERIVTMSNAMLYGNLSIPLGTSSWRLGVTAGSGSSTYNYRVECTKAEGTFSCLDGYDKSTNGTVTIAGFFADWGADGFGGRMGFSTIKTRYDDMTNIDGQTETASGNGAQTFIDLRYAF